jgi:hypothetical protein
MNTIYGWGKEDDALVNRLLNAGIDTVLYPKSGKVIDMEEINMKTLNIEEKKINIKNKKDETAYEKLTDDFKSWKKNGLSNLTYKILDETKIGKNIVQIKVDLMKKEDEKKNSQFYKFNFGNNFNRLYNEVRYNLNNMKTELI